jgi:hypothetical protein
MAFLHHVLLAVTLLSSYTVEVRSFSANNIASISSRSARSCRALSLYMNKDDSSSEDGVFVKSVLNKEIVYDEKTGRFFESKFGQDDCIPDEEYCYLDKSTGESIRLTVEEKERIFMDSLQVSFSSAVLFLEVRRNIVDFFPAISNRHQFIHVSYYFFSSNLCAFPSFRHTTHRVESY